MVEKHRSLRNHELLRFCRIIIILIAIGHYCSGSPIQDNHNQSEVVPSPHFEVESIRPSDPKMRGSAMSILPSGISFDNLPVRLIIEMAYGKRSDQLIGLPAWVDDERFTIRAKVSEEDSNKLKKMPSAQWQKQISLMTQMMLKERLSLDAITDERRLPVYLLVVDKKGLKITPDTPTELPTKDHAGTDGQPPKTTPSISLGSGQISAQATSLNALAGVLSHVDEIKRRVVNRTGITDKFTFVLRWNPVPATSAMEDSSYKDKTSTEAASSVFTALRDELGLRLDNSSDDVEVIVIRHIDRPSEN